MPYPAFPQHPASANTEAITVGHVRARPTISFSNERIAGCKEPGRNNLRKIASETPGWQGVESAVYLP
jgi:hypothetical protein